MRGIPILLLLILALLLVVVVVVIVVVVVMARSSSSSSSPNPATGGRPGGGLDVDDFVLPPLQSIPVPKGGAIALTSSKKNIAVQVHSRLAGAIWSFTVGGKPYVTELPGNGGSLQYACFANVDNPDSSRKAHSESYNPTQAGNARDRDGRTTSVWSDLAVDSKERPTMLFSKTRMAFYTDPSSPHANRRDGGLVPVFNTRPVSDFVLDQFLHLGYRGEPNVLHVRYVLNVPETLTDHKHADKVTFLIAEMPTGYMHADFTRHLRWNAEAKIFEALPGDTADNVDSRPDLGGAVATPDGAHCMGVRCIKSLPKRVNVPKFSVSEAKDGEAEDRPRILNKWALTTSLGGPRRHFHGPITTEVLLIVGTLDDVAETFRKFF